MVCVFCVLVHSVTLWMKLKRGEMVIGRFDEVMMRGVGVLCEALKEMFHVEPSVMDADGCDFRCSTWNALDTVLSMAVMFHVKHVLRGLDSQDECFTWNVGCDSAHLRKVDAFRLATGASSGDGQA